MNRVAGTVAQFAIGFVGGYLIMSFLLWIVLRLGHVILWIFLFGPMVVGLVMGVKNVRDTRRMTS